MTNLDLTQSLHQLMEGFIQERLQSKIEKLSPDDPKYQKLTEQFQFDNWVTDAARRVSQLQVVTHSLKAIHSEAKGSNLYAPPSTLENHSVVGSHILASNFDSDVVGNAAALDVYKFLRLEHNGQTLLSLVLSGDRSVKAALSADAEKSDQLIQAFASITEIKGENRSHTRAKQLYWLIGDNPTQDSDYQLLAPLYATSLAHSVFKSINHDRFSEESKEARKAYREDQYSKDNYRIYPNLAVQKIGGSNQQNVSQLNSERGGNNYLLASLPPSWQSKGVSAPLNTESAFFRFSRRPQVKWALTTLINFLSTNPADNVITRNRRDGLLDTLLDELILFTAELRQLEPGWSTDTTCRLPDEQKRWLDPKPYFEDSGSATISSTNSWPEQVTQSFARWFNNKLKKELSTGDPEHDFWVKQLERKLSLLKEELPYV